MSFPFFVDPTVTCGQANGCDPFLSHVRFSETWSEKSRFFLLFRFSCFSIKINGPKTRFCRSGEKSKHLTIFSRFHTKTWLRNESKRGQCWCRFSEIPGARLYDSWASDLRLRAMEICSIGSVQVMKERRANSSGPWCRMFRF
jgi:hypothetical protein